ncbi:serine/threonine-protein kinase SBK2 [Tympanuchus pallidicinctus]|uniref:serine/threonine-protein kinase SBK2 n=1 Tax=Tympanuchus pallidicinctus TaxID=109042 RepID=UPI00228702C5|nr:serine/threonine-protein kinase SBK2 [Tympanuchus pallidicinctus]
MDNPFPPQCPSSPPTKRSPSALGGVPLDQRLKKGRSVTLSPVMPGSPSGCSTQPGSSPEAAEGESRLPTAVCPALLEKALVFLQSSAMAENSSVAVAPTAAPTMLEELLEITAQSLVRTEVAEHYEVIRELGRGKYGHVMLVTHRQRGTPMALKLLPKASTKLHTFLYEYCVALSLATHPAIIGMFGIAIESSQYYGFLYEPAMHKDLISIIKPRDGIPEPAAKHCAKQLVSALEFIHSRGLVYRDVKPENVLLFDPECRRIKLTDFGLTRPKGTKLKLVAGVIPYTAPELSNTTDAQGVPIDASMDAWAFGVLLFCLLTGYFPWEQSLPKDPFFEDFMLWQETGLEENLPRHWKRLTAEAALMLRSLLALDPAKRCPVGGALRYVNCPWRQDEGHSGDAAVKP